MRPALIVLLALCACDDFEMLPDPEGAAPDVPMTAVPEDPDPLHELPLPDGVDAQVTSIVDGDTIHVVLDGRDERVRYIGMDTPETGGDRGPQPYGAEARERNRELVEGQTVRLVFDVQDRDRYGRLLAYVYTPEDGTFVNAVLVSEGFARVLTVPPNVRFASVFRSLETEARDEERNLWQR
ncbi:MAG: thermonuclease family protein [Polyangiales bacterium]